MFRRVFFALVGLLIASGSALWAGDSAIFVNLGFSADGRFYVFAQHGVRSGTLRPWADIFIVDVERNAFVPGGRLSYTRPWRITTGQDGSDVMRDLFSGLVPEESESLALRRRHGVWSPEQGLPLYVSMAREGDPRTAYERDNANKPVEFRDFASGASFRAVLVGDDQDPGTNVRSSFFINLSKTRGDQTKNFVVGSPSVSRPGILSYRIRQVLISPSGDSLIFVIEMKQYAGRGTHNIRFMVEALRF